MCLSDKEKDLVVKIMNMVKKNWTYKLVVSEICCEKSKWCYMNPKVKGLGNE